VTSLEAFLKAEDLDVLLRARGDIGSLTPEESARVVSVIQAWDDRQAVANLLFHPDVMPVSIRFEALDRALRSHDIPYFVLAATVGLQAVGLADVPSDKRTTWIQTLLGLVQSTSEVLAGRASVTLSSWSKDVGTADILPELLSLYPVPDESACRNIVAVVLARIGDLPVDEFDRRLTEWRVSSATATALRSSHRDYVARKARDEFRAMIMKVPALPYIPNLSEGRTGNVRMADRGTAGPVTRKPWWRIW
jgi:hypothetical protein